MYEYKYTSFERIELDVLTAGSLSTSGNKSEELALFSRSFILLLLSNHHSKKPKRRTTISRNRNGRGCEEAAATTAFALLDRRTLSSPHEQNAGWSLLPRPRKRPPQPSPI
ncbi:unnamed protein product [Caenorhabditis auriculariae]|uniref:Uncharacterized protein n=1 Tax=Caenorhabditis auriculariae TaxID=2777116 RepID=A0A8S1HVM8_9PELO|nr:unnamed protein product [Caenorhabditis auriculariae]